MPKRTSLAIIFIAFLFTCLYTDPALNQTPLSEKNVLLDCKNEPLRSVLKKLSDQCKIGFVFQDDLIESRTVSCDIDSLPLDQALSEILKSKNISFKMIPDGPIVLYNAIHSNRLIKGWVVDASNGNGLPWANILQEGTSTGTVSDPDGYFTLRGSDPDTCTIRVSYIGYHPEQVMIHAGSDTNSLKIEMRKKPIESEAVIVTSEKAPNLKMTGPQGEIEFSPKEVHFIPSTGPSDVNRIIQMLPGIGSTYDRPSEISIQGGHPYENLFLLDGIPVYKPEHYLGFLSAFQPRSIEKVQLYKGNMPAKYDDVLSGIIDMTVNTVADNKFRIGLGADLFGSNAFMEFPISKRIKTFVSYRWSYDNIASGSYYKKIGNFVEMRNYQYNGKKQNDPYYFDDFISFYDFTNKNVFSLSLRDQLSTTLYIGNDRTHYGTDMIYTPYKWQTVGLSINWSHSWSQRFNTEMNYIISDFLYQRYYDSVLASRYQKTLRNVTVYLGNTISRTNLKMGLGIAFRIKNVNSRDHQDYPLNNAQWKSVETAPYIENIWQPMKRIKVSAGLKLIHFKTAAPDDEPHSFIRTYWSPRISGNFSLTENLSLNGSWGTYHQFINFYPLGFFYGYQYNVDTFWSSGNSIAEPATSQNAVFTLKYENDEYFIGIESFVKRYLRLTDTQDYLVRGYQSPSLFLYGSGSSKGVEITARKKTGIYSGWISYAWNKSEYQFEDLNYGLPFPGDFNRVHQLKLINAFSFKQWHFSITGVFASGKPCTELQKTGFIELTNFEKRYIMIGGLTNEAKLPPYRRVDFQLTKNFKNVLLCNWEIGLSLLNVFNHENIWERRYGGSMDQGIGCDEWLMLGFTPMAHVSVEFN